MSKLKANKIHRRRVVIGIMILIPIVTTISLYLKTKDIVWSALFLLVVMSGVAGFLFITRKGRDDYRLMSCGILQIDQMPGEQFEEYLLVYFKTLGYKAELTRLTGDFGADLILEKNGEKIVVQAKRWSSRVGISAIQQIVGAIRHYKATYGMVVTTNYFSNNARELAKSNGIILWDRDYIIHNTSKVPLLNKISEISGAKNCPICSAKLVQEKWKKGYIIHCENYPDCRYIKTL